jgi:hypothetical protein
MALDKSIFESLSEEKQIKVEHIYHIASILAHNQSAPLTVVDFDYLYDQTIPELEKLVGSVRSAHHPAQYNIEGE